MNRKGMATALAAALAGTAGLAQADVTLFGHLDESVIFWDEDTGVAKFSQHFAPGQRSRDNQNLVCTTCSIGFKGSEDLGNGLKAIFKLDFQFDINNRNKGAITDRDQWVGLAGEGWGKLRFGTISTGYKSTGAMIDPIYRTVAQARDHGLQSRLHSGAGENGEGRLTNHIRYDSPSFSGFRVIVDYALDSNPSDGSSDNPWGLTGVYRNGPILGFVSYITNDQGGKDDAWKIGGSYDVTDDFRVFAQYENDGGLISQASGTYWFQNGANLTPAGLKSIGTDSATHNQVDNADVWHFGLTYTLADNLLYFAFGKGGDAKGNGQSYNTSYTTWSLVGAHSFSKRTLLYAGFVEQDFDATGEGDVFALGIKHKF